MRLLLGFILLISSLLPLSAQEKLEEATLTIKGEITSTLFFTTHKRLPFREKGFSHAVASEGAQSEYTFNIPSQVCKERLYFSCNGNFTFLELKPGQHLTIELDNDKMRFSGDNLQINNYLYDWVQLINSFPNALALTWQIRNYLAIDKSAITSIGETLDSKEAWERVVKLDGELKKQFNKAKIIDKEFNARQSICIKYLVYEMHLRNYETLKRNDLARAQKYGEQIKPMLFDNIDILEHPEVEYILKNHFAMTEEVFQIKRLIPELISKRTMSLKNAQLQEYYALKELNHLFAASSVFRLDEITKNVSPYITSMEGKSNLKALEAQLPAMMKENMQGLDAFPFELKDVNDKIVKLSDFKGKYVFIDLWATWCAPCVMNIPHINKLEERLHGENIEFVSISVDKPKDREKWKSMVKSMSIKGTALRTNNAFEDEVIKYYNVRGIPHFILIDPQGKLISGKCRQPMDPAFSDYLIDFIINQK